MCTSHSQLAKHIVKGSLQETLCKLIWACPLETPPTLAEHTAIRPSRFVFHPLKTLFCSHPPTPKIVSQTTMQIRSWTWPFIAPWGIWSDDAWGWRRQEWNMCNSNKEACKTSTLHLPVVKILCSPLPDLDPGVCKNLSPCKILSQTNKHQDCTTKRICKILPPSGFAVCSILLILHLSKFKATGGPLCRRWGCRCQIPPSKLLSVGLSLGLLVPNYWEGNCEGKSESSCRYTAHENGSELRDGNNETKRKNELSYQKAGKWITFCTANTANHVDKN